MNKIKATLLNVSRTTLLSAVGVCIIAALMLFRLSSLTNGLSEVEISTLQSASSISSITEHMVNAPYKLAVYVTTHVFDSAFGLRLTGSIVGGGAIVLFYLLNRKLFGTYVSVIVTAMFGSSSLLLHNARLATPNSMLLSLLAVIAVGFYLRFGKRKDIGWILTAATVGLSVYTPGMIIFLLGAGLWQFRHVRKSFEQLQTPIIIITSVVFGLLIAPFIISLVRDIEMWRAYVGLPMEFAPIDVMARYAGTAVVSIFVMSPNDPNYWLGRQPVLDIFSSAMLLYGAYHLIRQYRLDRLWTIGGIFLLAVLWIGASTNRWAILILLPFIYLVIGVGIQKFINVWLKVFPRNPIARTFGSALLCIAIALSLNFQIYRYFVAWPHADATKAVFSEQYPQKQD